jgi:soluble lytic murein transglycosylase-like protein
MNNYIYIFFLLLFSMNGFALEKYTFKKDSPIIIELFDQIQEEYELKNKILEKTPQIIKKNVEKYLDAIFILANHYELDPVYLFSLIWVESSFKTRAISNVGARGLMQIMPRTESYIIKKISNEEYNSLIAQIRFSNNNISFFEANNLVLGSFYITYLRKKFKKVKHFTIAYNMGPGWVYKKLRNNYPVGNNNNYINKIIQKYTLFSKN